MWNTRTDLIAIVVTCSIALLSCGTSDVSEPVIEDPPGLPAATTIELLLDNFHEAYTTMNYEEYAKLLDDEYVFVFAPRDINEEQPSEFWPRLDDLKSTLLMFSQQPDSRNRIAQVIHMDFDAEDPVDSDEGEGWKKIILSSFELEIEAIQADNGETWFLRTRGGYFVDIFVKQIEADPPVWTIVRIVDRPPTTANVIPGVGERSWGKIKSMFR